MFDLKKMKKIKFSFLMEIIFLLAAVLMVDHTTFSGDRFWGVHPHPFLFIVLLISVQYGAIEGLITALLASTALLTGNIPEQNFSQNMYDYFIHIGHQPIIWSVSAIIIGGFRDRYIEERRALEKKLTQSQKQVEVFSKACEISDLERKRLETHVSGQSSFLLSLHQTALNMDAVGPEQILDNILEITQRVTKSEKCSWYALDNSVLETSSQLGWQIDEPYSRVYTALSPLFQEVVGHKRTLVITNKEDEIFLDNQGMMAGPVINPNTGKVYGMLKIERLNFISLNLKSVETFKQLCEWMGTLFDPAPVSRDENMVIIAEPRHELFSNNYFERLSEFLTLTADKNEFGNQSIIIRPPQEVFTTEHLHRELEVAINEILHGMLENKTLFFDGQKNNSEFIVILANTSPAQAKEVSFELINSLEERLSNKIDVSEFSVAIKSTGERSDLGTATSQ
jgi:polysaccharide biosynthesis protein PelD